MGSCYLSCHGQIKNYLVVSVYLMIYKYKGPEALLLFDDSIISIISFISADSIIKLWLRGLLRYFVKSSPG